MIDQFIFEVLHTKQNSYFPTIWLALGPTPSRTLRSVFQHDSRFQQFLANAVSLQQTDLIAPNKSTNVARIVCCAP
jgi:hypothetical protein